MNYQDIRADDPGGDINTALATLQAMTIERSLPEKLVNERTVYAALGGSAGEAFLQAVAAFDPAPESPLAPYAPLVARIVSWMKPGPESGVDVCNAEVQAVLNALASGGVVVQSSVDTLIGLGKKTALKYPGIHLGDLQNARAI